MSFTRQNLLFPSMSVIIHIYGIREEANILTILILTHLNFSISNSVFEMYTSQFTTKIAQVSKSPFLGANFHVATSGNVSDFS